LELFKDDTFTMNVAQTFVEVQSRGASPSLLSYCDEERLLDLNDSLVSVNEGNIDAMRTGAGSIFESGGGSGLMRSGGGSIFGSGGGSVLMRSGGARSMYSATEGHQSINYEIEEGTNDLSMSLNRLSNDSQEI